MLRRLILAAACFSGLTACEANMADYDYQARYPIKVETRTALLVLDPGPGGSVLPQNFPAIGEFATDYGKKAAGTVTLQIGANSSTDPLATNFARQIVAVLHDHGIPSNQIGVAFLTDPESAKYGRAVMQFPIYVALADECGTFKDQPGFTPLNENSYGFGCASQRNLAAMVVNPRDLVDAETSSGRMAARADVIVGKYILGSKIGAGPPPEGATLSTPGTTGGL